MFYEVVDDSQNLAIPPLSPRQRSDDVHCNPFKWLSRIDRLHRRTVAFSRFMSIAIGALYEPIVYVFREVVPVKSLLQLVNGLLYSKMTTSRR